MKFILMLRHFSLLAQYASTPRTFMLGVFLTLLISVRQDTSPVLLLVCNLRDIIADRVVQSFPRG